MTLYKLLRPAFSLDIGSNYFLGFFGPLSELMFVNTWNNAWHRGDIQIALVITFIVCG